MAGQPRRTIPPIVRREDRHRAAARTAALSALKRLRQRISTELTEHDEIIIAAEVTDAALDAVATQPDIGRPIPHTHV